MSGIKYEIAAAPFLSCDNSEGQDIYFLLFLDEKKQKSSDCT